MVDRFLLWLGAGLVTVGMSAGMLAGTGIAAAETGSGTDAGGTTSSQSTKPAEKKADSEKKPTADPSSTPADSSPVDSKPADDADKPKQDTPDAADPQPTPKPDADVTDKDDDVATDKDDDVATKDDDVATDPPSVATNGDKKTKVEPPSRLTKPVAATPEPDVDPAVDAKTSQDVTVEPEVTTVTEPAEELNPVTAGRSQARTQDAAVSAAVTFAAAPPSAAEITSTAAAPPFSGLLSAIGTIIFNLYGFATRLIGGPPTLPPNSTVTVRSSTLRIDCADGIRGARGLVHPGHRRTADEIDLPSARLPGPGSVVQPHGGSPRRADEQHRRRALDNVELLVVRRLLARCATDAASGCEPVRG